MLADAELQRRAVLDQVGDVAPDLQREGALLPLRRLQDRLVAGDHGIDVADVDEAVAEHAGCLAVDLGDDDPGALRGRLDDVVETP